MKVIITQTMTIVLFLFLGSASLHAQFSIVDPPCNKFGVSDNDVQILKLDGYQTRFIRIDDCDGNDGGGGGTEDKPFDFEIYFTDMSVLLLMQSAIINAERVKVNRWLGQQQETFRKEINRQLGTNHNSFAAAQKDFYKKFEQNFGGLSINGKAGRIARGFSTKSRQLDETQVVHTKEVYYSQEWKTYRNWCGPHSHSLCDQIGNQRVQGTLLKNVTSDAQLNQLYNSALGDFGDLEFESAQNLAWSRGIYNILNDNSFLNTIVNNHLGYYNNNMDTPQDRVFLMTAYLVQYNLRGSGVLQVPISDYVIQQFWDGSTLLSEGKKKAPEIDFEASVFDIADWDSRISACKLNANRSGDQGDMEDCLDMEEAVEDMRNEVLENHLTEIKERIVIQRLKEILDISNEETEIIEELENQPALSNFILEYLYTNNNNEEEAKKHSLAFINESLYDTSIYPSCESFEYTTVVDNNGWITAAVSGVWDVAIKLDSKPNGIVASYAQPLYFQLPGYYSNLKAAELSAAALWSAFEVWGVWYRRTYRNIPSPPVNPVFRQKLLEFIKDEFKLLGGRVDLVPPAGFTGIVTPYQEAGIGGGGNFTCD